MGRFDDLPPCRWRNSPRRRAEEPDPLELAQFYSALLGLDIDENGDDDWRSLTGPGTLLLTATGT